MDDYPDTFQRYVENSALMTAYRGLAMIISYRDEHHRLNDELRRTLALAEDGLNNMIIEFGRIEEYKIREYSA